MRVLLVDNGTHYKKRLLSLLEGFEVTEVSLPDLSLDLHNQGYDLIVLSGAYKTNSVKYYGDSIYKPEQDFVAAAHVPVIGICFGAQILAHMYGASLSFVPGGEKVKGLKRIWNVTKNPFDFFPYYGGRVWAAQKWRITELPEELQCWCASNEGIEVFKHVHKPLYGLQFHPERRAEDNDGARIFAKILELEHIRLPQSALKNKQLSKVKSV